MEIIVHNDAGQKIGNMQVPDSIRNSPVRYKLLRDVVRMYEANKRHGTVSTKTRAEVSGGGKKPWAQKHTGKARAGSSRSPVWRGGGVAFGPKPRSYFCSVPKMAKRQALSSALSSKIKDNEIVVVDKLDFALPKTKQVVTLLKSFGMTGMSCLIVIPEATDYLLKSSRNIPYVKIMECRDLNAYEILKPKKILITKQALSLLG